MFTGIIEDVATIESLAEDSGGARTVRLGAPLFGDEIAIGASVAVAGVCLTVTRWTPGRVEMVVGPETLACTAAIEWRTGTRVNVERALRVGDRLGGHWVMGHVDGVGMVRGRTQRDVALDVEVALPTHLMRYCIMKGSITLDGVSLTINELDAQSLKVSLIPHTLQATTLADVAVGQKIHVEVDVLGKYVERMMGTKQPTETLSMEKLKKQGFLS